MNTASAHRQPKRRRAASQHDHNEVIEVASDGSYDSDVEEVESSPATAGAPSARSSSVPVRPAATASSTPLDTEDDTDDIIITNVNRIRRMPDSFARNVRQRTGPFSDPELDDDVLIVDERLVATPPPPPALPNHHAYRRSLLQRLSANGAFLSNPHIASMITRFGVLDDRGQNARNRRGRTRSQTAANGPAFFNQIFDLIGLDPAVFEEEYSNIQFQNEIPGAIMDRIERDNDRAVDQRLRNENVYNRKALQEKKDIAKQELPGYTNDIDPSKNLVCELCGVTLGEGIPPDFKPNLQYNKNIEEYINTYQVNAPWFCSKLITEPDRDLSKRVFVSKCGHVFCGRCIKNIGNRPKRKKSAPDITIDNPKLYAPSACPSHFCGHKFRGKKPFTELYP